MSRYCAVMEVVLRVHYFEPHNLLLMAGNTILKGAVWKCRDGILLGKLLECDFSNDAVSVPNSFFVVIVIVFCFYCF